MPPFSELDDSASGARGRQGPESPQPRGEPGPRPGRLNGGRDPEQMDARRNERVDLVRAIMRKRRDEGQREQGQGAGAEARPDEPGTAAQAGERDIRPGAPAAAPGRPAQGVQPGGTPGRQEQGVHPGETLAPGLQGQGVPPGAASSPGRREQGPPGASRKPADVVLRAPGQAAPPGSGDASGTAPMQHHPADHRAMGAERARPQPVQEPFWESPEQGMARQEEHAAFFEPHRRADPGHAAGADPGQAFAPSEHAPHPEPALGPGQAPAPAREPEPPEAIRHPFAGPPRAPQAQDGPAGQGRPAAGAASNAQAPGAVQGPGAGSPPARHEGGHLFPGALPPPRPAVPRPAQSSQQSAAKIGHVLPPMQAPRPVQAPRPEQGTGEAGAWEHADALPDAPGPEGTGQPGGPHAASGPGSAGPDDPGGERPSGPSTMALPIVGSPADLSPSDAAAEAIGLLRTWRAEAERAAYEIAQAQVQVRTERARDRLDPAGDLRRALADPDGAEFLRELLDQVIRPEDPVVAGNGLGDLHHRVPESISQQARRAFGLGVHAGPGLPWLAVPVMRRMARAFFGDELVVDTPERRRAALAACSEASLTPRLRPLGDPVAGERGAQERLRRMQELIADPATRELEIELSDIEPSPDLWDFDGTVERIAAKLAPLYLAATSPGTMIMLRATGERDLELTVEVFTRLLDEPALHGLIAGVALPAQFPETTGLLRRLSGWAHMRREDMGAPIVLAVTRAGSIARERVDAVMHGWHLASFAEERDVDANVIRLLDQALDPEHAGAMHVELDADFAREAAFAIALSRGRRLPNPVRITLPVSAPQAEAARALAAGALVVRRIPLIPDREGGSMRPAVPFLLRRVEVEQAAAAAREMSEAMLTGRETIHPEDDRLLDAIGRMPQLPGGRNRAQERVDADEAATVTASIPLELFPEGLFADEPEPEPEPLDRRPGRPARSRIPELPSSARGEEDFLPPGAADAQDEAAMTAEERAAGALSDAEIAETGPSARLTEIVLGLRRGRILRNTFRNAPPSDPTLPRNREWAARIRRRVARSELGVEEAAALHLREEAQVEQALATAAGASGAWGAKPGWERAASLVRLAKAIEANRALLIEVAMSEAGLAFRVADADVSRAVDLANHAAHLARQLDRMQGARFEPVRVTVSVPGSMPPVSGALEHLVEALAAGSAVIVKGPVATRRTAAIATGVVWESGIGRDLVQLVFADERIIGDEQLGRRLIVDDRVQRVLANASWEQARAFLRWRPDLPLIASAGGKNAVIVTPSADLDRAVRDIARSAFRAAGQLPGHVGTVILVGSMARRSRFLEQLADAVTSIRVGYPADPAAEMGPLRAPADSTLRVGMTVLGEGESWLVEPRQLDDTGRLWSPGVRLGVRPGSYAHVTEFPGPVLNVMHAPTLAAAIEMQNATPYAYSAGLQSLDRVEIADWVQGVEAGSLFVNRELVTELVQRQPEGGWRRSAVGTLAKTGGPNALMALGTWRADPGEQSATLHLRGLDAKAVALIEAAGPSLDYDAFDRVRQFALSAQIAWNEEFGEASDATGLAFERNLFRYRPAAVTVRLAEDGQLADLIRVLVGARVVRAVPEVSCAQPLPAAIEQVLRHLEFPLRIEDDVAFGERIATQHLDSLRIRLIGGDRRAVCAALGGDADMSLWSDPVTPAGRVELLPFLREQSISLTAHRDGRLFTRVDHLFEHERLMDPSAPIGDALG